MGLDLFSIRLFFGRCSIKEAWLEQTLLLGVDWLPPGLQQHLQNLAQPPHRGQPGNVPPGRLFALTRGLGADSESQQAGTGDAEPRQPMVTWPPPLLGLHLPCSLLGDALGTHSRHESSFQENPHLGKWGRFSGWPKPAQPLPSPASPARNTAVACSEATTEVFSLSPSKAFSFLTTLCLSILKTAF